MNIAALAAYGEFEKLTVRNKSTDSKQSLKFSDFVSFLKKSLRRKIEFGGGFLDGKIFEFLDFSLRVGKISSGSRRL